MSKATVLQLKTFLNKSYDNAVLREIIRPDDHRNSIMIRQHERRCTHADINFIDKYRIENNIPVLLESTAFALMEKRDKSTDNDADILTFIKNRRV